MDRPAGTSSTTSETPDSTGSTRTVSFPDHAFVLGNTTEPHRDLCFHREQRPGALVYCLRPESEHMTEAELREAFGR